MYPNQEIKALRKGGQLDAALKLGQESLAQSPNDVWLKREVAWVYYEYIKKIALSLAAMFEKKQRPDSSAITRLHGFCQEYAKLNLEKPDMALSNINLQLSKIGKHLDFYAPYLVWAGIESFSHDDHVPFETEQGVSPSKVTKIAREAAAWCNSAQRAQEHGNFILSLVDYAINNHQEDSKQRIWLFYDRVKLHLRLNNTEAAAADMREVLKTKRKEFWAWGRMAMVQERLSPKLAIACLCQAMLCRPDPKFTGRLHMRLGKLLLEQNETSLAVAEYLAAADIYTKEGWAFPDDLDGALQAAWFDPSIASSDRMAFYQSHAESALRLLYDKVKETRATFLAELTPKSGGKSRALVSVVTSPGPCQRLVAKPKNLPSPLTPGQPLVLLEGVRGDKTDTLGVEICKDGKPWDYLKIAFGVVENLNKEGTRGGVFIDKRTKAILMETSSSASLKEGDPVQVLMTQNPVKEDRWEAWFPQPLEQLPNHSDITLREGNLKVHQKGFAFVDDAFVPPPLVDKALDQQPVKVLCINEFNKAKGTFGWKAVKVTALERQGTGEFS